MGSSRRTLNSFPCNLLPCFALPSPSVPSYIGFSSCHFLQEAFLTALAKSKLSALVLPASQHPTQCRSPMCPMRKKEDSRVLEFEDFYKSVTLTSGLRTSSAPPRDRPSDSPLFSVPWQGKGRAEDVELIGGNRGTASSFPHCLPAGVLGVGGFGPATTVGA